MSIGHTVLKVMSGSMVLLDLGSVLMSMVCVTTKVQADVNGLCCHLKPC